MRIPIGTSAALAVLLAASAASAAQPATLRLDYYHTGNEKSVVGIAKAVTDAYGDPKDPSGKLSAVDIAPVKKLKRPVTLAEIKADQSFRDFPLVRISRLSVMPVSDQEWKRIEELSRG